MHWLLFPFDQMPRDVIREAYKCALENMIKEEEEFIENKKKALDRHLMYLNRYITKQKCRREKLGVKHLDNLNVSIEINYYLSISDEITDAYNRIEDTKKMIKKLEDKV